MNDAEAVEFIRKSGIYQLIDRAKLERRSAVWIPESLWHELRPLVDQLCAPDFRSTPPTRPGFMLDGMWVCLNRDKSVNPVASSALTTG
jgi:hypothetical protein